LLLVTIFLGKRLLGTTQRGYGITSAKLYELALISSVFTSFVLLSRCSTYFDLRM